MVKLDLRKLSAPVEALRSDLSEAYKRLAGCPEMKSSGIAIKPGNLKNLTAAFQIEVSRPRGWKLGRRRGFGGL